MTQKRQRMDSWEDFDNDDAAPAPSFEPVPLDNIMANRHENCFACLYVNKRSMEKNESYMNMMLMYKDNAFMMAPEALYNLIKTYFDETIKPEMEEAYRGSDAVVPDWSLECIREHFTRHTRFPTDELRKQLRSKKAIRDTLNDMIVEMSSAGDRKVRVDYLKELLKLEKEIVALLKSKECISTMLGYSETLNY